jgi:hypothetical protein
MADDHRMLAEGLRSLLEPAYELVEIVESTDNGAECLSWPDGGTIPFRTRNGKAATGCLR